MLLHSVEVVESDHASKTWEVEAEDDQMPLGIELEATGGLMLHVAEAADSLRRVEVVDEDSVVNEMVRKIWSAAILMSHRSRTCYALLPLGRHAGDHLCLGLARGSHLVLLSIHVDYVPRLWIC
jgi:hypothetical protein